jgi:release factor glutamine methyltransferase
MTVGVALKYGEKELSLSDVPSSRLDTLILLEDLLGRERSWLLAHTEAELSAAQAASFKRKIDRRKKHEPLSYIRGFNEFYGRNFKVNKRVLVPRPESETIIDLLKTAFPSASGLMIADVGTGSGCLGITAGLELPGSKVDLYDIDSSALAVAKHNAHIHELHVQAHKRDLLNRPSRSYNVILANLPYVPDGWEINASAMKEPRLALSGGKDGLDLYRRLFKQLQILGWWPLHAFTEAMPSQHKELAVVAKAHGFYLETEQDYIQVFRA